VPLPAYLLVPPRRPDAAETAMIRNDQELTAAQAQIVQIQRVLLQMRGSVSPDEFRLLARSSRSMIERIQRDVLDYLTKPIPQLAQAASASA
jgi:hypothetical protein